MTTTTIWGVGIDVAQATLAVSIEGRTEVWEVANRPAGYRRLVHRLLQRGPAAQWRVVLEATGNLELGVSHALLAAGIAVCRLNPRNAKDLRQGLRGHCKSDASDAVVLRQLAHTPLVTWPVPTPAQVERQTYLRYRSSLVEDRSVCRQQLRRLQVPAIVADLRARIADLTRRIAAIEQTLRATIAADHALAQTVARLRSIPGVGPITAWTVAICAPPLDTCTGKTLASFIGVAPHPQDSGQHRGQRHIRGGHQLIRDTLYMAAVSASTHNPRMRTFAARLREKGKPPKVVLTACMRKLTTWFVALEHQQTQWQPAAPLAA